jgi:hypothetical protein
LKSIFPKIRAALFPTLLDEFVRAQRIIAGLTTSMPMMLMVRERIEEFEAAAQTHPLMNELRRELRKKLRAIKGPEDYTQMGQAYEAYAETSACWELHNRGVVLQRTPGTGHYKKKRPDFIHTHVSGNILFEIKALDIADKLTRHKVIAEEGLEVRAELDQRARTPGVHFSRPQSVSGHRPTATAVQRIDETAQRIKNIIKPEQIQFGPTVLVVDLGRLSGVPFGPSGLLPVFFHDAPPAESCVSGELWQIALGKPGEQIFHLPDFDGESNLSGHQSELGVLHEFPSLIAITFQCPRWSEPAELLTIWNSEWDQSTLVNQSALQEHEIVDLLQSYSDGLNDQRNELGWDYRVTPLRSRPRP